jgi:hypothetical protein
VNPLDELTRVLPRPPAGEDLPRQQQHKTDLLTIIAADRSLRRAVRQRAIRGWLVPAMAAAGVTAVAVLAVVASTLVGGQGQGRGAGQGFGSVHPTRRATAPSGDAPAAPPGGSPLTTTRHWSIPADLIHIVAVSVNRGSVTVTVAAGGGSAAITATPDYRGQAVVLTSQVRGGSLTVTARCPQEPLCEVALALRVPAGVAVRATSDLGDVRVTGLHGGVTASSEQGGIVLTDLSGRVSASNDLGNVTLADLSGSVTAHTGAGTITGTGLTAAHVALSSKDGNISAAFGAPPARVTVSSQLGDVALRLPSTFTAAHSFGPFREETRRDVKYDVVARTQAGTTSVTVPQSARSPYVIRASSELGSVAVVG